MKYFKTFILLFVLFCLFFLMSCAEDEDPDLTPTELLSGTTELGKTWRITSIETSLGTINPRSCVADNNITYFPNRDYEVNEGASKCDPSDPVAYEGTWLLSNNQDQVRITIGDSTINWVIVELTSKTQKIRSTFDDGQRTYVLKPL